MGRFTKAFVVGTAAALLAAGSALADFTLSNFDNGTNVSEIGTYFYYYSACSPHALNKGPCKIDDLPVLLEAVADDKQHYIGGADDYGPLTYLGGPVGAGGTGKSAALTIKNLPDFDAAKDVTNGQPITIPGNSGKGYYPGFGFGILLTDDDDEGLAGFANVTAIKFKVKATGPSAIKMGFKVETTENSWNWSGLPASDPNPSNCYSKSISVTPGGDFTEQTILLKDLEQENNWGTKFTFDKTHATKIAWYVNSNVNATLVGKDFNIYIDDVVLVGTFDYTNPDICGGKTGCTSSSFTVPTPSVLLSNFDNDNPLANKRGEYWYHYTDEVGGGNSQVTGLIPNENDGGNLIMDVTGNGQGGGNGAHLEYELGSPYKNASNVTVEPFVGIGTNLFREGTENSNFTDGGSFTGIYFQYKTVGTELKFLDVEFADEWDVRKKPGTDDKWGDLDGEVYYTRVPGTNNEWKSATVPFSSFVLPSWVKRGGTRRKVEGGNPAPLNTGKLAQLKFKAKGSGAGEIFIDNVYFYGADAWGDGSSVKVVGSKAKVSGLRATYSRGVVGVNWNAAQAVASGKIQLVNTKGRVVASAPISASGSKVTANLRVNAIPTGMYFVRMNAKDVNGAKIVQQSALSIVK